MRWTERLWRLAGGDPTAELIATLRTVHQGAAERAERLAAYAAQAPTAGAEEELERLSAAEAALAGSLAAALSDRGATPITAATAQRNGAAPSHWARLVIALEESRRAHHDVARVTAGVLAAEPALADLMAALTRQLDLEMAALRELIARADPHALN